MSKKSWRSLITFVVVLAAGMWYFSDERTPEQRDGKVAVEPNS